MRLPATVAFAWFWPRVRLGVHGWTGTLEGRSLYALARDGPGEGAIVEIGSSSGRSTICLARGSKAAGRELVYAIDLHIRGTQDAFERNLRRFRVDDWVVPVVEPSDSVAAVPTGAVRLLFVDGDHTYERVKGDIEAWLPRIAPGGVVVFDDYFGTKATWGVRRAVDELLASGAVRRSLGRVGTHVWTVKL
jgi:predicted O-methyltransferase YrrM